MTLLQATAVCCQNSFAISYQTIEISATLSHGSAKHYHQCRRTPTNPSWSLVPPRSRIRLCLRFNPLTLSNTGCGHVLRAHLKNTCNFSMSLGNRPHLALVIHLLYPGACTKKLLLSQSFFCQGLSTHANNTVRRL